MNDNKPVSERNLKPRTVQTSERPRTRPPPNYVPMIQLAAVKLAGGHLPNTGEYLTSIARLNGVYRRLWEKLDAESTATYHNLAFDHVHEFWTEERLALLPDEQQRVARDIMGQSREQFVENNQGANGSYNRYLVIAITKIQDVDTQMRLLQISHRENEDFLHRVLLAQIERNLALIRSAGLDPAVLLEIEAAYTQSGSPLAYMRIFSDVWKAVRAFTETLELPIAELLTFGVATPQTWETILTHAIIDPDLIVQTPFELHIRRCRTLAVTYLALEQPPDEVLISCNDHHALRSECDREDYLRLLDHIGLDLERPADFATQRYVGWAGGFRMGTHFLFTVPKEGYVIHVGLTDDRYTLNVSLIRGNLARAKHVVREGSKLSKRDDETLSEFKARLDHVLEVPAHVPRTLISALELPDNVRRYLARRRELINQERT